jgi:hypothetical protein
MKIYYISTSDNEYNCSIKGYYSTLEKAKENMCHFSDWYRNYGTGEIYEITLDTNEITKRLVYKK